jgi:UDP-N-acetylmuramate--alanine ligase
MSGLARILMQQGHAVSGTDVMESAGLETLRSMGVSVEVGHDASHVGGADLTVHSSAIMPENPELAAARQAGIPTVKRATMQGALTLGKTTVAVAGTHGKTTTSSMIAHALRVTKHDPSHMIGGDPQDLVHGSHWGDGTMLVIEADEFDRAFLELFPKVAVITAVEVDHLDTYESREGMESAFQAFVGKVPADGTVTTHADSASCRRVAKAANGAVSTWSLRGEADWMCAEHSPRKGNGTEAIIQNAAGDNLRLSLRVPGDHNLLNAMACVAALDALGIPPKLVAMALSQFHGVRRRFEVRGRIHGVTVVDDYAHHPTEVRASLRAAKEWQDGRVICVYQPHLRSRTADLFSDFVDAFRGADKLILVEIYQPTGREEPSEVSSADLAAAISRPSDTQYAATLSDALAQVTQMVEPGDLVIVMGAGDITELCDPLLEDLHMRTSMESRA